jgi:hypothetical protein
LLVHQGRVEEAEAALADVTDNPGGIAGLFLERARLLLGDAAAEARIRDAAERLAAPGLLLALAPAPS